MIIFIQFDQMGFLKTKKLNFCSVWTNKWPKYANGRSSLFTIIKLRTVK